MKKLFLFLIFVFSLCTTSASAEMYPLTATQTPTSIVVTMTGVTDATARFELYNGPNPVPPVAPASTNIQSATNGSVVWTIAGSAYATNRTYYFSVLKLPGGGIGMSGFATTVTTTLIVNTGNATASFYKWPLTFDTTGQTATISGKIDTSVYPSVNNLKIELEYSRSPFVTDGGPSDKLVAVAHTGSGTDLEGISDDGTYRWNISGLTPDKKYFFRHIIKQKGTTTTLDSRAGDFDSTKGYIGAGSQAEQAAFDAKSYHLLAPWPGLAVLMDPDLCAQQKLEGKIGENAVCDINGFLNFAFKTLIGLTAVVLVLRLMYEGYAILTSDVPFIQAKSKEGFKTALIGLLLALSAYLILNTINPKLVENSINVASVEVGVEKAVIDPAFYQTLTGQTIKAKPVYVNMVTILSQQKSIDACLVKATITVESSWVPNVIGCDENVRVSGVPSRTAFVGSGIKLDGTKFTDSQTLNICPKSINSSQAGYGLDWRFSKGGGLMQITKFPTGYNTAAWREGVKEGGTHWINRSVPFTGWQTILVPEDNVTAGINLLKQGLQQCGGSAEGAFRVYQAGAGGGCNANSAVVNATVAKKMREYQICKSNPAAYAL